MLPVKTIIMNILTECLVSELSSRSCRVSCGCVSNNESVDEEDDISLLNF